MKNAVSLGRNSFRLVLPVRSLALLSFLVVVVASPALAKRNDDQIVLDNRDRITGEIKKVEKGPSTSSPPMRWTPSRSTGLELQSCRARTGLLWR